MNVEEVSSIVVNTDFHPHRERRSSLRHYLDDRTLVSFSDLTQRRKDAKEERPPSYDDVSVSI
ncbi:MAG: hypothetical protein ACXQT2_00875 [Methanotrichaceae archaeon]